MKKVIVEKRAGRLIIKRWLPKENCWQVEKGYSSIQVENYHEIHIDDDDLKSITWGVVDFQERASEREEVFQWDNALEEKPTLYDREKMPDALAQMISKHDDNLGITWSTVDYYLDERCKFEKPIFYEKGQVKN